MHMERTCPQTLTEAHTVRERVTGKGDEEIFWVEVRFYRFIGGWTMQMYTFIKVCVIHIKVYIWQK